MLYYAKRMDTYMGTSFWKNKGVVIAKYRVWPHLWPSTELDYLETMLTRAPESTVFGLKSTENAPKSLKKSPPTYSGHCVYKTEYFPLKKLKKALKQAGFRAFQFFSKNAKFPLWPHVLTTYKKMSFQVKFRHIFTPKKQIPFFVYCVSKFDA